MSKRTGKKFEIWEHRIEGQIIKVEVRVCTDTSMYGSHKTTFKCQLPGSKAH